MYLTGVPLTEGTLRLIIIYRVLALAVDLRTVGKPRRLQFMGWNLKVLAALLLPRLLLLILTRVHTPLDPPLVKLPRRMTGAWLAHPPRHLVGPLLFMPI